jgi:hypothetical protein
VAFGGQDSEDLITHVTAGKTIIWERSDYEIGSFYLRYGTPEIGVRWLLRALKLDHGHQPRHQALSDYYQRTGDLEKVEQHRLQLR